MLTVMCQKAQQDIWAPERQAPICTSVQMVSVQNVESFKFSQLMIMT